MKYHICIIPSEPVFSELDNVISSLAEKYNAPVFHPHLTILSSVEKSLQEIQQTIERAVVNFEPWQLSLGPVSFSTTYFQSVFVRVNSIAPLMNINLSLKKAFGFENSVYMPHISLLYGDHDMKTREKITKEITIKNSTFTAYKVAIIPDDSDPINWKPIATITFGEKK